MVQSQDRLATMYECEVSYSEWLRRWGRKSLSISRRAWSNSLLMMTDTTRSQRLEIDGRA